MVGLSGFEPLTSRLSAVRSSQLSYRPVVATLPLMHTVLHGPRPSVSAVSNEVAFPKNLARPEGRRRWLPENWVDGFDYGENELDWIL
jgi:hypothetical protein